MTASGRHVPSAIWGILFLAWAGLGPSLKAADSATPFTVNVRDFGAAGDGTTLDTAAIGKAIDACVQHGGGTVQFPAGKYLTGTIILKDNITLNLDAQATILGSTNINDYSTIDPFVDAVGVGRGECLVGAEGAKNIAITGAGTIDGQGEAVIASSHIDPKDKSDTRPFLLRWVRCTGLTLQGVHLEASAAWTCHIYQCQNVTVKSLLVHSRGLVNNDGIDIDSSSGVNIADCTLDTGDDSICLKATSLLPCKDVTVTGCTISSGCGTLKLGTESMGDFDNIRISDCHVIDAGLGAIKLMCEDGAHMQNVVFSNITVDKAYTPIFLRFGTRLKTFRADDKPREPGCLKNITIKDVVVHEGGTMIMSGVPGYDIEDITLENIEVHGPNFSPVGKIQNPIPEKEKAYPEVGMFGRAPASGIFLRHVKGIKLINFVIETNKTDPRPFVVCDDAQDVAFTGWKSLTPISADRVFDLSSCQRLTIDDFKLTGDVKSFLAVSGADSSGLQLNKVALPAATTPFVLGADVKPGTVAITP